ncbi:MAG: hydrolase [Phycisphaerales bacterium]|nr:hydrolase [Phycisphaerales bacterium]
MDSDRFPCPCCGFLTRTEPASGTYDICPVCYWEDDPIQLRDPSYAGGANQTSLEEARANFRAFRACEERCKPHVRAPLPEETP